MCMWGVCCWHECHARFPGSRDTVLRHACHLMGSTDVHQLQLLQRREAKDCPRAGHAGVQPQLLQLRAVLRYGGIGCITQFHTPGHKVTDCFSPDAVVDTPCEIEMPQRGAGGSQLCDACICHALAAAEVQGCQPRAAGAERPQGLQAHVEVPVEEQLLERGACLDETRDS